MSLYSPDVLPEIETTLQHPFSSGWNRIPGVEVEGSHVRIIPDQYFFRYDSPSWRLCDWNIVEDELLPTSESNETSLEQLTLDFILANSHSTIDAAEVLGVGESVYSYLFRPEHLGDPGLQSMGVTEEQLRVLREMGTFMSLNRVELTGDIANVGPAWFFPVCAQKVFGLSDSEATAVDELYHGTFFNESRRVESIKAHAALGGRLVHGCQGAPNQSGGCVVYYGTDVQAFAAELGRFKVAWMDEIRKL